MSKFTTSAATMQTLSRAGAEEASRLDENTGDIEHLLLAVVIDEGVGGQALRSLGISLDRVRDAVAAQHAEQLASLGIHSGGSAPGEITFPMPGGFSWNDRALGVMRRASEGENAGDSAAVLRELVDERSGLIEAVLHRLDTSPDEVRAVLDDVPRHEPQPRHRIDARSLSGVGETFVPASVDDVWALLVDPARRHEWDAGYDSIDDAPAAGEVGASWIMRARRIDSDGTELKVRPERERTRVEVLAAEAPHAIEWSYVWPDAPQSNWRSVRIELEPAAGGTQLRIRQQWHRGPGTRWRIPLLRWAMRPLYRFMIWMQISNLGASIGRVFR